MRFQCVPGGAPDESAYFSGALIRKNIAHNKMRSMITRPRVLILKCAVLYERLENKFSSLNPVLLQERGFLQNIIAKISLWKPDLLVVQRSVSRIAQEMLLAAGITVILNVVPQDVDYIARCT